MRPLTSGFSFKSTSMFQQEVGVAYLGQQLATSLKISNDRWRTDTIEKVASECGCTTIGAKGQVLSPFESIEVPVKIRVDGLEGVRNWKGVIFFASGRKVPYQVTANVRTPQILALGKVFERRELARNFEVPLFMPLMEPVEREYDLQGWGVSLSAGQGAREIRVSVARTGPLPIGKFDTRLQLPIGAEKLPELWFRLQGEISSPFTVIPDFLRVNGESGELGGPVEVLTEEKGSFEVMAALSHDLGVTAIVRRESDSAVGIYFSKEIDISGISLNPYLILTMRWKDEEYFKQIPVVAVTKRN